MAQIIKHRRGSIDSVKNSTSRKGELIMATGSIGNLNGPFVFIGTDEGSGLYSPASKLYAGSAAPTLNATTYGTTLDGTPFYAESEKSLYILNNSNVGNSKLDLTGNIEGNTISGVTINDLESTNVTASFVSASFKGSGAGLYGIPATGITGLNLSKIYSGSVQVSTDSDAGTITLSGGTVNIENDTYINNSTLYANNINGNAANGGYVDIYSENYSQLNYNNQNYVWLDSDGAWIETNTGDINLRSYNSGQMYLNTDGGEGNVTIGNNSNDLYLNTSNIYINNTFQMYHDGAMYLQDNDGTGIEMSSGNYVKIKHSSDSSHFYANNNYAEMFSNDGIDVYTNSGNLWVYNNSGNVNISSYDNGTLYLNTDGGEGHVNIGNGGNEIQGNTTITNFSASDYAQLESNSSYVFVEAEGAYIQNDAGGVAGFTARPNAIAEVTGSLEVAGGKFVVDGTTGDIRTSGSITMKGNITIGDSLSGDTINLNAGISSSLIPSGTLLFDLGSNTNKWDNIYVGTVNADNINLGSVSFSGLTQDRVVFVGESGSLVDNGGFTFAYNGDYGDNVLEAPIIRASNNGSGYNFQVGDDMWIGDINQANAMMFKGVENENYSKVYLGNSTPNNYLSSEYGTVYLSSNNNLNLYSQNDSVDIESYDGTIYLNTDSGNNVRIGGNTYIQNRNLHVDMIWDYSDGSNYLQLYGWNTNDGYWWEGGNGHDTTLLNNYGNANLNILNTSSGNVNIDATNGSVNIHSQNGMNVTGSLIVSDASGVFNSSLNVNNSNLTLNNGSNLDIQDNGTLTVNGNGYFNNNVYVTGTTYSDQYRGLSNDTNVLYMNGGGLSPDVELASVGQISLWAEGNNGHSGIHLTGSVYSDNNIQINNGNRLYTNYISDTNGNNLHLNTDGAIYLYSDANRYIELSTNNAEDGTNYLHVTNDGVDFSTYDYTSDLTHTVYLDNTGSLKLTNVDLKISGSLSVDGNTRYNNDLVVGGDMYVSGNFQVLGTGSIISLTGSQVDFGTNQINLNTYAPFERFAGINVYDSGSNVGVTGSLLWDSLNDVWIYANPSGSNYASARFIAGPKNTGSLGEEQGLTNGHFPIATGDDHISDSLLTYIGTTLSLNTNKFTVDSESGDTLIQGNFTIQGVGATDNGDWSSYLVFRNSDNVLGFVDTTDTGNITEGLLGYNATSGLLEFSSLIDGGSY